MDIKTFTDTIAALRDKLYRFALKMLQNEDEAEDNVQEILLRMWIMRDKIDKYGNPQGLAMQINKNLCIDKLRRKKAVVPIDSVINLHDNNTEIVNFERNDAAGTVKSIVNALPELQRHILKMKDIYGYEIDEIAAITATRPEAVRVTLSRARKRVRDEYFRLTNEQFRQ